MKIFLVVLLYSSQTFASEHHLQVSKLRQSFDRQFVLIHFEEYAQIQKIEKTSSQLVTCLKRSLDTSKKVRVTIDPKSQRIIACR